MEFLFVEVGYAIVVTEPPTTGDPAVGGFFDVSQTTRSPFLEHNFVKNVTKFGGFPIMSFSVLFHRLNIR